MFKNGILNDEKYYYLALNQLIINKIAKIICAITNISYICAMFAYYFLQKNADYFKHNNINVVS